MATLLWLVSATVLILRTATSVHGDPQVPAMFALGDSLIDPGNNNHRFTLAKANFFPNGIDFSGGVTGRFCNGGTNADHLAELLGLPWIPPFNNPNTTGSNILKGVNYASAASGILDETGKLFGKEIPMNEQVKNFNSTVEQLQSLLGNETEAFLGKSLFFIVTGNNDYLGNYLLPFSSKPKKYGSKGFAELLLSEFRKQLKGLYDLGARKFLISGLPALGCIPSQLKLSNNITEGCVESVNMLASEFNTQLQAMVHEINSELAGSNFLYWDTYNTLYSIIKNASQFGFKTVDKACCGQGGFFVRCLPLLPLYCKNRSEFVFWDTFHSTDAVNKLTAAKAYETVKPIL